MVDFQAVVAKISRDSEAPNVSLSQRVLLAAQLSRGVEAETSLPDDCPFETAGRRCW
jgi:hypothetical protein